MTRLRDTGPPSAPSFWVLLGGDYAGKSSVMTELRASVPAWRYVSVDGSFVDPEHAVLSRLKRALVTETLPGLGSTHSADFATSLLQTAVVYLRDRVLAAGDGTPVLVDSYYYKILAKCRLVGDDENPMFAWWRGFPQPRGVLYLDVPPDVAWTRCAAGAGPNRLEHYGVRPDREAFESFQSDLRKLMLDEVRDLPTTYLTEGAGIAETAREVEEVLRGA